MIQSKCQEMGAIDLPSVTAEIPMIPFNLKTLEGLWEEFKDVAENMLKGVKDREGTGFFTIHGRFIEAGDTLRRGGAHIDGNYMNYDPDQPFRTFGGGGWKLGQEGPYITSDEHNKSYNNPKGGIILASTVAACLGFTGTFEGLPSRGGDCTHMELSEPFELEANKVYYGNNHFVHESLPVKESCHRTFYRITLPMTHNYEVV